MSDLWKRELAAMRDKVAELDAKLEELLAAGPVAPGVVEAAAELAHEMAQLERRMTAASSASDADEPDADEPDADEAGGMP